MWCCSRLERGSGLHQGLIQVLNCFEKVSCAPKGKRESQRVIKIQPTEGVSNKLDGHTKHTNLMLLSVRFCCHSPCPSMRLSSLWLSISTSSKLTLLLLLLLLLAAVRINRLTHRVPV